MNNKPVPVNRSDLEPGFWCEYIPPRSRVEELLQMPSVEIDGYKLSDAVMTDWRAKRSKNA